MVFVTGDCHGDFKRFSSDRFPIQKELTKDDFVIICGDFGGVWSYENESNQEKHWLKWLENKSFTTLFIDGNHENFDRLYSYPIKEWHGGSVHEIRPSVLHLIRGEIFDIDDKKFFAFGGARSHDIKDGILNMDEEDKIYRYNKMGAYFRIRNYSWWDLEMPTDEEMENGIKNLKKSNFKVDYVITHCTSTEAQALMSAGEFKPDKLTDYLQEIKEKLDFKKWFFGHYHMDRQIDMQFICLYDQIMQIC